MAKRATRLQVTGYRLQVTGHRFPKIDNLEPKRSILHLKPTSLRQALTFTPVLTFNRWISAMVWQVGDRVRNNQYEIKRILGQGYFGITYLIEDQQGKQFALKTLSDTFHNNPERDRFEEKFMEEASRLRQCHNSHIVQVEAIFKERDRKYDGIPLEPPTQHNKQLSERVERAILSGLALEYQDRPQSMREFLQRLELDPEPQRYQRLRDLLAAGKWKEADEETAWVMLEVAGRTEKGTLD